MVGVVEELTENEIEKRECQLEAVVLLNMDSDTYSLKRCSTKG